MQNNLNEDFIEEYSKRFSSTICDKFFVDKTQITGAQILNISPSKQVNFFVIKLLFNNWQEESQRLESPFFDYTATGVKEAMVQFMNVLSRHISIERKEFEILLQDAVRDTLFLIMAPNLYMEVEMGRKGTETLTEKSAKNLTKYLKIAKEEFSENIKSLVGTDRDEINLDESIITQEILDREISNLNDVSPISPKTLLGEDEAEDIPEVESDDVFPSDIATSKIVKSPAPVLEKPELEETEEAYQETETEDASQVGEEVNEVTTPPTPEIKETPTRFVSESIITNLDPEDEDDEDAILNSRFEDPMVGSIAESHEKSSDRMISAISLNNRYMFIDELFDGEANLFTEALSRIEKCGSFDESVEIIVKNYAKEFHWDMNSNEVKELLKIVFRRFR